MTVDEAVATWPELPPHPAADGKTCFWSGTRSETGQCPDSCDRTPSPENGRRWIRDMTASYNLFHAQVRNIAATWFDTRYATVHARDAQLAREDYAAARAQRDALWPLVSDACDVLGVQVWHENDGSLVLG